MHHVISLGSAAPLAEARAAALTVLESCEELADQAAFETLMHGVLESHFPADVASVLERASLAESHLSAFISACDAEARRHSTLDQMLWEQAERQICHELHSRLLKYPQQTHPLPSPEAMAEYVRSYSAEWLSSNLSSGDPNFPLDFKLLEYRKLYGHTSDADLLISLYHSVLNDFLAIQPTFLSRGWPAPPACWHWPESTDGKFPDLPALSCTQAPPANCSASEGDSSESECAEMDLTQYFVQQRSDTVEKGDCTAVGLSQDPVLQVWGRDP